MSLVAPVNASRAFLQTFPPACALAEVPAAEEDGMLVAAAEEEDSVVAAGLEAAAELEAGAEEELDGAGVAEEDAAGVDPPQAARVRLRMPAAAAADRNLGNDVFTRVPTFGFGRGVTNGDSVTLGHQCLMGHLLRDIPMVL